MIALRKIGATVFEPIRLARLCAAKGIERKVALQAAAIAAWARLAIGHDGDMADFAGIAPGAAHHPAFMHQGAAKPDAEIEVVVFRKTLSEAVELLAERSGGHVRFQECRQARQFGQALPDGDVLPAGHRRRADEAHGLDAERTWQRHADPKHAALRLQHGQLRHHRADDLESSRGRRVGNRVMQAGDNVSAQVDQRRIDADRRDMDANRKPAIRD